MIQLWVNDILVDLDKSSVVSLNYDLNNKDDLSSFTTVYSSSLELPLTKINAKAFQLPDCSTFSSSGSITDGTHDYSISVDSIVRDFGRLVVHKVTDSVISCNLFSYMVDVNKQLSSITDNFGSYIVYNSEGINIAGYRSYSFDLSSSNVYSEVDSTIGPCAYFKNSTFDSKYLLWLYAGNIGKPKDFNCDSLYNGPTYVENAPEQMILQAPHLVDGSNICYQYRLQHLTPVIPSLVLTKNLLRSSDKVKFEVSSDVETLLSKVGVVGPALDSVADFGVGSLDWLSSNADTTQSYTPTGPASSLVPSGKLAYRTSSVSGLIDGSFSFRGILNPVNISYPEAEYSNEYSGTIKLSETTTTEAHLNTCYVVTVNTIVSGSQQSRKILIVKNGTIKDLYDNYESFPSYDEYVCANDNILNLNITISNFAAGLGQFNITNVCSCLIMEYIHYDDITHITRRRYHYSYVNGLVVYAKDWYNSYTTYPATTFNYASNYSCSFYITSGGSYPQINMETYFNNVSNPWTLLKKIFKKFNIRFKYENISESNYKLKVSAVLGSEYYSTNIENISEYIDLDSKYNQPYVFETGAVLFSDEPIDSAWLKKSKDLMNYAYGSSFIKVPNYPSSDTKDWCTDKIKYCCTPYVFSYSTSQGVVNENCIAELLDDNYSEVEAEGCLVDITDRNYQGNFRVALTDNVFSLNDSECYFTESWLSSHSVTHNIPKLHTCVAKYSNGSLVGNIEQFMYGDSLYKPIGSDIMSNIDVYFSDVKDSIIRNASSGSNTFKIAKQLVCKVFINRLHMDINEFVSNMYWFDSCNWIVSKVQGYIPGVDKSFEVTFTPVGNIENYFKYCDVTWSGDAHSTITATVGGSVISSPYHCIKGTVVHFSVSVSTGYHFTGWSDGNMDLERDLIVNNSVTLSTTTAINEYTVSVAFNQSHGKIVSGGIEYTATPANIPVGYDSSCTFSFVPNNGYQFIRWTDGNTDNPRTLTHITADVSKTCESEVIQYTLTLNPVNNIRYDVYELVGSQWTITSERTFDYGTQLQVFEVCTHSGYELDGWTIPEASGNKIELTIHGNVTLEGKLKVKYFTVSCTANNCTVTGTGSKAYGSTVTITASPSSHYKIESDPWTNKPQPSTVSADFKSITFTMPAFNITDIVCTAVGQVYNLSWSGANQTIAVKVNGTTVTDNPHSCTYPSTVQVTSTPVPTGGYSFTRWVLTSGSTEISRSTSNPFSFSIDKMTTVTGVVTAVPYNTVSGTISHASISSGLGLHNYGTTVRVNASANNYYELYNGAWSLTSGSSSVAISSHADDWSWVEFVQPVGNVTVNITARNYTYNLVLSVSAGSGTITGSWKDDSGVTHSITTGTNNVGAGKSVTITANPDTTNHYIFNKWSDGDYNSSKNFQMTEGTKTLHASFKLEQYTLTISAVSDYTYGTGAICTFTVQKKVSGSWVTTTDRTFDYGTQVRVYRTVGTPYDFVNWSGSVSGTGTYVDVTMNAAKSVVANCTIKRFKLTMSGSNCATSPTIGEHTGYKYGDEVIVSCTPNTHYHWGSWSDGKNQTHTITITAETELTATVIIYQHTLTLEGVNCTVSGGGTYNYGTEVEVSVPSISEHYHWGQWSDGKARTHTVTVDSTKTLKATAAIDTNTITLTKGTGCASVSGAGTYNYNTSVNISASASTDYHWGSWNDGNTSNPRTVTVTGNLNYTANCVKDSYKLTLSQSACTITGATSGNTYPWGTTITLNATPSSGYQFISSAWSVPSGVTVTEKTVTTSSAKLVFVMPKAAITIGCSGVVDTATITYNTYLDDGTAKYWAGDLTYSGGNVVEGGAGHSYAVVETTKGNSLTVTAKTDYSGYTFLGWYTAISGGTLVTSNASMTQVVDGTVKRYTARYSVSSYVTFSSGSYLQVGTRKRFGFVISDSSAGLYSNAISIEVHRRRTGVAEDTIATGSITLSSSGTYTQLPSTTFQATDSYTDATYYIYAYKDGTFLGSIECSEQVSTISDDSTEVLE